jgi:hypothetical protein
MTEAEWMAFTDPWDMLDQIRGPIDRIRGPDSKLNCVVATDRQLLLWGSACCRHLGPFVEDARWLNAIRVVEHFADGEAAYPEVLLVGGEMQTWFEELGGYQNVSPIAMVARSCADLSGGVDSAYDSMGTPFLVPADESKPLGRRRRPGERRGASGGTGTSSAVCAHARHPRQPLLPRHCSRRVEDGPRPHARQRDLSGPVVWTIARTRNGSDSGRMR